MRLLKRAGRGGGKGRDGQPYIREGDILGPPPVAFLFLQRCDVVSHALCFPRRVRITGILFLPFILSACTDVFGTRGSGPLQVRSITPEEGETGVPVLTRIQIRFSTGLDESTVAAAVRLEEGGRTIRTRMILENLKVLYLEPTDPLDFGTSYRVVLEPNLLSRSGTELGTREVWEFSTEGVPFPSPSGDSLRLTVGALAHDSMMGRGSGTSDEYRAAQYLRDRFVSYGLNPAPGGMVQPFQAPSRRTDSLLSSQNVLAVVPGSGTLAREWVVVGAHYDHIGVREQSDGTMGINNGADDNASGTALVLEMARVFQAQVASGGIPTPDRRSVLFAAFGAEEQGLLGSCHYAMVSPAEPVSLTRAMMNFDMVGRLRNDVLQVFGFESWGAWADMVGNANRPDLILSAPPPCVACTDFACFRDRGVPYIWFFTGTHEQYHTPADDVSLINFPGLVEVGEVALRVLSRLTVMPEGPSSLLSGNLLEF